MTPQEHAHASSRLEILQAILAAMERRQEVTELVWAAATTEAARDGLCELLAIDGDCASALLDMQIGRLTGSSRRHLADQAAQLRSELTQA
ncbi:DNA gyrase subunit A [Nocardioides sp. InS609-2]|uniref:DNA gyrase subunit A n=1 Tax=Nocardioides sp. InS609-2 TaxID=2760705 RepID=UPI0020C15FD8|nr:DNA gyrase subunit A [Nocardioides sp. InS609-2]